MGEIKKFEDVLDECLERLVKGETLGQCLQRFPEHADELRPLLETVVMARRVAPVQPRAEFRERARFQFNAALQQASEKKGRPLFAWGWQPRWAATTAILLIVSLAGTGTVAAARGSMPDSPLYPVKLATEEVQMTLTFSDLGKAELNARLADERVTEIAYLAVNSPGKIPEVSAKMKEHLGEISSLLARAPVVTTALPATAPTRPAAPAPVPAPAPAPPEPFEAERQPLVPLAAPEGIMAPAAERAPGLERKEDREAIEAALSENETGKDSEKASPKKDKRAKLKSTVEAQASSNSARLRSLLETAPESAKPALRRAIEESEKEYKNAIEALED